LAGIVGWTLLFGYIGSMAMYAFALGEFTAAFDVVPKTVAGVPVRPLISVLAVAGFVGVNLLGARTTGVAEDVLVARKVGILVVFGVLGLVYAFGSSGAAFDYGVSHLGGFGPIMAAAISFVAFQGWQLLYYDQERVEDPVDTIRKAVYISIPVAVAIYVLVGMVTVNLVPQALESHPHVALKDAASMMVQPYGLARVGAVVLALSALFSTGSAINATLFSSAHFAKGMLSDDLLPDQIGDSSADGIPERTVVVLGALTAAFTWYGSLGAITSFASLSFILVFGAMSYLAFRQRDHDEVNAVVPAVGTVGASAFFPLMLYNLYSREPNTFYMVLGIAVVVLVVELLYFERDLLEEEVTEFEPDVGGVVTDD
jgi:amino acid transporter